MRAIPWMALFLSAAADAAPVDLTWQGRLTDPSGSPLNGSFDLTFRLWNAATLGTVLSTHAVTGVPVVDGHVSTVLSGVETTHLAGNVWVGVTFGAVELTPRTPLTSAPRAASLVAGAKAAGELVLAPISGPTCTHTGALGYDAATTTLQVCVAGTWSRVGRPASGDILQYGAARYWYDGTYARSCEGYRRPPDANHTYTGATGDALYRIDPDGSGSGVAFDAWCDMTSDNGGWTLVATVATQGSFWNPENYSASTGPRGTSIGTPSLTTNFVMHLTQWSRLFANRGTSSEFRLTVRRNDNNAVTTLGFLDGLQMNTAGAFTTNPTAARKGNGTVVSPASSACVIQYNSDFLGTITNEYFQAGESPCTGFMGWNGSCGYTSLGHDGPYYGSGTGAFTHACSLDLQYYCSANNTTGPSNGSTGCYFKAKWYWIR